MDLGNKVKNGLKWSAVSKLLSQLITWGLTIYVMRLLQPEDYGLLAMAMIFMSFLMLLKEFGLGPAVVQNKNISDEILRKIFGVLILLNISLLLLLYILAPFIADFFDQPLLSDILRVLSLTFLLIPFETIPNAMLQREMRFKHLAAVELLSAISGGLITLYFAYNGWAVWSLVYGGMAMALIRTVSLNVFYFWLKLPSFKFQGLWSHVSFGGLITVDQSLWFFYSQADAFIVGKLLGSQVLGFYSVAMHLSSLPMQKLNSIINQVAFPAFSQLQDDKNKVEYYLSKSIRLLSFVAFPIFFGIAAVAEDLVLLALGEKWHEAILPMVILCAIMPIRMISNIFPTVVRGCGRADISMINLMIACLIMPSAFYFGANWGLEGICYAWLLAYPVVFTIEVTRSRIVTNVSIFNVVQIIIKPLIISILMYLIVVFVADQSSSYHHAVSLGLEIASGIIVYLPLILLFCKDEFKEVLSLLKR